MSFAAYMQEQERRRDLPRMAGARCGECGLWADGRLVGWRVDESGSPVCEACDPGEDFLTGDNDE